MSKPGGFKQVKHKAGSRGRNRKPGSAPKFSGKKGLTLWDQASRWYDSLVGGQGTDFQKDIIMPGVFRLLEVRKKDRVLDLACGQGVFSRYLARKGIHVEGLDSSSELVKFARARLGPSIQYHVGDAGNAENFEADRFDGIACLMAIQNIEKIDLLFKSASRWLKTGKHFVVVMTHPCFRIPRQSHWGWDDEKKLEYRRVDHYMTETTVPILTPPPLLIRNRSRLRFTARCKVMFQRWFKLGFALMRWRNGCRTRTACRANGPRRKTGLEKRSRCL